MASTNLEKSFDAQVGTRLKKRRQELGMSQEALGNAFGVTFQQVQKYEKGTNRMGSSRLAQAASILKVPPTYFFETIDGGRKRVARVDGDVPDTDEVFKFLRTSDGAALAKAFQKITGSEKRRSIVRLVQVLADEE